MAYVNEDSICSAGGLSPVRSQAITLNNADYWCNLNKKNAYIFLHENVFKCHLQNVGNFAQASMRQRL